MTRENILFKEVLWRTDTRYDIINTEKFVRYVDIFLKNVYN